MRLQLLSDLHLETEVFEPEPAPGAELLVLAGDIDRNWLAFERFRHWPVPVIAIAGNHEFDHREIGDAWQGLRGRCEAAGIRLLECERLVLTGSDGRRIRLVGTVRWCDFDLFGNAQRERAMRAAGHYLKVMRSTRRGAPFDAAALRDEALACRGWLAAELAQPKAGWDATVVVTHYAPSIASADPRYGLQPSTASFCNADDALLPHADLWLHGHLHCRLDYTVAHPGGSSTRIVCNARGHARKNEHLGHAAGLVIEV